MPPPDQKDLVVTLTYAGGAPLLLSAITTSGGVFSIIDAPTLPATVSPANSERVSVRFAPTAHGSFAGTLKITSDDPDRPIVTVSLSGPGI